MALPLTFTELGSRDSFPYRNLADGEIRLVVIKRHSHWPRANTLTCTIQHANLDAASVSAYKALSYTWGDDHDVASLRMRDETTGQSGEITVTSSLLLALQTILGSTKWSPQTMWVDQICINQCSAIEKGRQVQLMRSIYQKAALVYVWLGPESENSNDAMTYLRESDETSLLRDFSSAAREGLPVRLEKAVTDLRHRAYWNRLWTMQESTALDTQKTIVFCGAKSTALAQFEKLHSVRSVRAWDFDQSTVVGVMASWTEGMDSHIDFAKLRRESTVPLFILVSGSRYRATSDPRDKIYSLLNFAGDMFPNEIQPDYSKTVQQTFTEFTLWSIRNHQSLDILGDCLPSLKDSAGPSWVPDYERHALEYEIWKFSHLNDFTSERLYRASGVYSHEIFVQMPLPFNSRLLSVSGVKISSLEVVQKALFKASDSYDVQKATIRSWKPPDGHVVCLLNKIPLDEVFRRTVYLDVHAEETEVGFQWKRGNDLPLPWELDNSTRTQAFVSWYFRLITHRRCPFYTKSSSASSWGLLGLGPATAELGDELWMLKGGAVLYILRPKAMTIPSMELATGEAKDIPTDAGMPTYELVGEAFVLGLMDGEIIDMLGDNPKRERPPPLAEMDRDFRTIGLI